MKERIGFIRRTSFATVTLIAIVASLVSVSVVALAGGGQSIGGGSRAEHWGVITRNTIGSPVGDLRYGP